MKKTKHILQSLFWTAVAVLLLAFCLRNIDWASFAQALRQCRWIWILWAMLAGVLTFWFRSASWALLLRSIDASVSDVAAFNAYNLANASNMLIPRSGELVRIGAVVRHSSTDEAGKRILSFDKVLGTVVVERLWDGITILAMTGVLLFARWDQFGGYLTHVVAALKAKALWGWVLGATLLLLGLLLPVLLRKFRRQGKLWAFVEGIKNGLSSSLHLKESGRFLLYTVLIWVFYWLICVCILLALKDIEAFSALTATDAFLLMLAGTLSSVIPVPGGFGAYHGVVGGFLLQFHGIPMSLGMIYATLNHESHVLVQVVLGIEAYLHETLFQKKRQ